MKQIVRHRFPAEILFTALTIIKLTAVRDEHLVVELMTNLRVNVLQPNKALEIQCKGAHFKQAWYRMPRPI